MIVLILWLITTYQPSFGAIDEQPLTGTMQKTTVRQYIHQGAHTWEELLHLSGLIVDKSLLIKTILSRNDTLVQINCPRKFGKTMNLQMLSHFLRIEVNAKCEQVRLENTTNYRFFLKGEYTDAKTTIQSIFTPIPLISKYPSLIENYMGKYPVININFYGISGHLYADVIASIGAKIRAAFEEHDYVLRALQKIIHRSKTTHEQREIMRTKYDFFEKILHHTVEPDVLEGSLIFLSELLHEQFDQKVFILFDDYDYILKSMLLGKTYVEEEVRRVVDFMKRFLQSTFGSSNPHLHKAIFTGIYLFSNDEIFTNLSVAKYYYLIHLLPFYGFVKSEVNAIFDYFSLSNSQRAEAHKTYDGYKGGIGFDISIYNPYSIVAYGNEKNPRMYWSTTEDLLRTLLQYMLKDENFVIFFTEIINFQTTTIITTQLTVENFAPLRKFILHANDNDNGLEHANTILFYMYVNGYFTVRNVTRVSNNYTILDVQIPNNEIREDFSMALIGYYYVAKCKISHTGFEAAVNYLDEIMSRGEYSLILFIKTLDAILNRVVRINGTVVDKIDNDDQRRLVNSTLYFVVLRVPQKHNFIVEPTNRGTGKEPDIIMYNEKRIIVIEIKLDAMKPNYALINAKKYKADVKRKRNLQNIPEIKFIGIGVSPFKTLFTRCEIHQIDLWH